MEAKTNLNPEYKMAASFPAAADGVISVGALQQASGKYGIAFFFQYISPNCSATVRYPLC
jgi:hypothetical protein